MTDEYSILSPVDGLVVRSRAECGVLCANKLTICQGFVYISSSKTCKLTGIDGGATDVCGDGDVYRLVWKCKCSRKGIY